MATIGDVVTTVHTNWLKRTDLTTLITDQAVRVYRTICNKIPFEALQTTASPISCVVGTSTYSLAAFDPKVAGIISIRIAYSSTDKRRLIRDHVRTFDNRPPLSNGKPLKYGRWASTIELDRPPDSASYTMTVRYWGSAAINATAANTTLVCPDEWIELIEWETYYRVLTVLGRPAEAAMLVQPAMVPRGPAPKKVHMQDIGIIPRLWNELLQTINTREHVDEDFAMQPIVRSYTANG
jgi:hypothetical protein